jgi:hypothetical protein
LRVVDPAHGAMLEGEIRFDTVIEDGSSFILLRGR